MNERKVKTKEMNERIEKRKNEWKKKTIKKASKKKKEKGEKDKWKIKKGETMWCDETLKMQMKLWLIWKKINSQLIHAQCCMF
jgi:hypothetical protein